MDYSLISVCIIRATGAYQFSESENFASFPTSIRISDYNADDFALMRITFCISVRLSDHSGSQVQTFLLPNLFVVSSHLSLGIICYKSVLQSLLGLNYEFSDFYSTMLRLHELCVMCQFVICAGAGMGFFCAICLFSCHSALYHV